MPHYASEKQRKMMEAIKHGYGDASKVKRQNLPPKSIASKYSGKEADTDDKGQALNGGLHGEGGKKKKKGHNTKKHIKKLKRLHKSLESFLAESKAAACIVMNKDNQILMGRHKNGGLSLPGGHVEINETPENGALRELKEESGLDGKIESLLYEKKIEGNHCFIYLVSPAKGKPKNTEEMKDFKYYNPSDIPWDDLRDCCYESLLEFVSNKLGKSFQEKYEELNKNIIRQKGDAVFEVTHGDALRLVGHGMFKLLKKHVEGMENDTLKTFSIEDAKVHIRKHMDDVYSGRVEEDGKITYEFKNQSLPQLTAALMSVFEWYTDGDTIKENHEKEEVLDEVIQEGIKQIKAAAKKNNIGAVYEEMRNIREEIRHESAVDIQQVEKRIMKLFDKLEDITHEIVGKHNKLTNMVDNELEDLESKLRGLQAKIDDIIKKPRTLEAYSVHKVDPEKVHKEMYNYLPKPVVTISPDGKIRITFGDEWQDMEKEDFLNDMKAKIVKK